MSAKFRLIPSFALSTLAVAAWSADAKDDRAQAHDLREKAHQLHEQALGEINDADTKQVESDKDFHDAAALEKKADIAEHVSAEKQRARDLRQKAHEDEREANTMSASVKVHKDRASRDEKSAGDAQKVMDDLKGQNASATEIKLLQEDLDQQKAHATAEQAEIKRLDDTINKLRETAKNLLAEADKLDPEGKKKDAVDHPAVHPVK